MCVYVLFGQAPFRCVNAHLCVIGFQSEQWRSKRLFLLLLLRCTTTTEKRCVDFLKVQQYQWVALILHFHIVVVVRSSMIVFVCVSVRDDDELDLSPFHSLQTPFLAPLSITTRQFLISHFFEIDPSVSSARIGLLFVYGFLSLQVCVSCEYANFLLIQSVSSPFPHPKSNQRFGSVCISVLRD